MRDLCPALANKAYFNYGGQGPRPTPSLEAILASWRTIQELGPFSTAVWPFVEAETSRVRTALAGLCGVPPRRLALTENVTSGCVLPKRAAGHAMHEALWPACRGRGGGCVSWSVGGGFRLLRR